MEEERRGRKRKDDLLRPNQQSFQELENFKKKLFTFKKVLFESAEKERESRKETREREIKLERE